MESERILQEIKLMRAKESAQRDRTLRKKSVTLYQRDIAIIADLKEALGEESDIVIIRKALECLWKIIVREIPSAMKKSSISLA